MAAIVLLVQAVVLLQAYRNLIYSKRKYRPKDSTYKPKVAIICPCKGIDTTFDRNIDALFEIDYHDYEIFFVVETSDDKAYAQLKKLISRHHATSMGLKTHLLVAGHSTTRVQKVHNLLCAVDSVGTDFEVLAFIDSDACPKSYFLSSMVHPLRRKDVGASTGHRWFIPTDSRLSSMVLSAMNAFFASALGPHNWNSTWGGAMAIRRDIFEQANVRALWQNASTDDYTLTRAIRNIDLNISFVPSCYIASYEQMGWRDMFNFARRQFLITRINMPRLWVLAIIGIGHFVLAFWMGLIVTAWLLATASPHGPLASILPIALLASSALKATARQLMIRKILHEDRNKLLAPALIDILLGPILHTFTLAPLAASGISKTVYWRGVKYTMHAIDHTEIVKTPAN